ARMRGHALLGAAFERDAVDIEVVSAPGAESQPSAIHRPAVKIAGDLIGDLPRGAAARRVHIDVPRRNREPLAVFRYAVIVVDSLHLPRVDRLDLSVVRVPPEFARRVQEHVLPVAGPALRL